MFLSGRLTLQFSSEAKTSDVSMNCDVWFHQTNVYISQWEWLHVGRRWTLLLGEDVPPTYARFFI